MTVPRYGGDKKPTILLADDTPTNLAALDLMLGQEYELLIATNGREAVEIASAELPDLIVLDVLMPGGDGFEACARLKADSATEEIPVIFVTALDQVADEARGLELGAIDFITKPFSEPVVRARIRNHLELKRQRDLLATLTVLDGLTGIANRRQLDKFLGLEWRRAARSGAALSLLLMDIDYFKRFNDALGHLVGDDCLKKVAQVAARACLRPGDLSARYGGEEFACVLADTGQQGAVHVAQRIVHGLAELSIPHPQSEVSNLVTISIGVATVIPQVSQTAESLIHRADTALYQAKDAGRNRLIVSE